MAKAGFKGSLRRGKINIDVNLQLYTWEENLLFFIYAPSLDITGYGNTEKEAKKSFEIMLQEFVDYTLNKKTIFDELEHLGWTVNRKKKRVSAPNQEELLIDNSDLKNIIAKQGVKNINKNVQLALA